jgi:hypothetical protein
VTSVETGPEKVQVMDTVEVRGEALVVNVGKRDKAAMFVSTAKIPLGNVLGAEANPEIELELWQAGMLGAFRHGKHHAPNPAVGFYRPGHLRAHMAIVIRLQDEGCERLLLEVEDPASAVSRINEAVENSSRVRSVA